MSLFALDTAPAMRCASLEHVSGGWMMKVECTAGGGTISLLDDGTYRGTGMFTTWSQEKLGATYQSLVPSDDSRVEYPQLG
ncbi:MAG TPA: hypothetical protein VLU46_08430 [Thermoanaerobaculia bacterium]|nr:hypothetical protein [Thermoanaerobaculia bacterium]